MGAMKVSLEKILIESDVVSLHVPLLPSTKHLIGKTELDMMKKSAILINTARGPVINEKALVSALKEIIFGAALDVFENEPKMSPGLKTLKNCVVTPHIGSATVSARTAMAECVARSVLSVLRGEIPPNVIN
jgi:lactate dehydrogenase-like 2-hydroxyacid dehydrogenase